MLVTRRPRDYYPPATQTYIYLIKETSYRGNVHYMSHLFLEEAISLYGPVVSLNMLMACNVLPVDDATSVQMINRRHNLLEVLPRLRLAQVTVLVNVLHEFTS